MLAVQGLTKVFGGFTAVNRVSFEVREGEILGLIGPNGSGKSTTFNLVAGSLLPSAGSIRFLGPRDRRSRANRVARYGIGRTYQIPRPFRRLSLLENVALAAYYGQEHRPSREQAFAQAREALELVGLPADPAARVDGLGAAALKKLELARALATQPEAAARRRVARRPRRDRNGAGRRHARRNPRPSVASPSSGSSTSWAC